MGRIVGWASRLSRVIERHNDLPFQYGTSDCYLLAADAVEAVTGERIFADSRRYKTETGAAKLIRRKGFETIADAFDSLFEEIPPAWAGRGDIGVVDQDGDICGGVFTQLGFVARGKEQLLTLPRSDVIKAWRVI
ncbi:MAG: hypothetical protein GY788_23555 [bacterium]|nr:hypothetical protein [bacterium]